MTPATTTGEAARRPHAATAHPHLTAVLATALFSAASNSQLATAHCTDLTTQAATITLHDQGGPRHGRMTHPVPPWARPPLPAAAHQHAFATASDPQPLVQSLRGKASMVRPFIPALRIHSLPLAPPSDRHIIVVEVPRSPEAPHLVPLAKDLKDSWGYPRRRGSDTDWLGESDLEAAYAARFGRRQAAQDRLEQLADLLSARLQHLPKSIWVTVCAACSVPSGLDSADAVDPHRVEPSMQAALGELPAGGMLRTVFTNNARPQVGLRRAVVSTDTPYRGQSRRGQIELLHDGSFAGALNAAHAPVLNGIRYLVQNRLELVVRDLVTVAVLHAVRRQGNGLLQVQASFTSPGVGHLGHVPSVCLTQQPDGDQPEPLPGSIALGHVVPVASEAPLADLMSSPQVRERLIRQLAADLVHQFAVASLVEL
ncbi:hypothetical protein OHV05_35110 (plasmid) [Kitasatospora sp. NBC_00070]|uniref:hypothetical protein n=1 Tax=Kitasatospora sp. NBC_00070 TaxID=2975962 RepID=UPI002F90F083